MTTSRREFLKRTSAATAVGILYTIPGRELWGVTAEDVIPEVDEALLREAAATAMEAARGAGAQFADVRVSAFRSFSVGASFVRSGAGARRPSMNPPRLRFTMDFGVRVLVDGAWGFASGYTVIPGAVAEVARTAVARARANRPRGRSQLELAPTSQVQNGVWATPIERDPFKVPVADQADLALAALSAAEGVRGAERGFVGMVWDQTLHVFASTEGTVIVQRLAGARPQADATGKSQDNHQPNRESVQGLRSGGYGYEAINRPGLDLPRALRETAARAVAGSAPTAAPASPVDVGRYDLVLGTSAVQSILLSTLIPALNLERVLGYHANRAGTSFATPPEEILDKHRIGSPLVTVRVDRTRPHAVATVGWDDEGVPAGEHTLIEQGVIVDYLTSRETATHLAAPYRARDEAVQSRGCTVGRGQDLPRVRTPNITLDPGSDDVGLDDIIADTARGFYVPAAFGGSDQQLLSGQFAGHGVREIRDGRLSRTIGDFAFHFHTAAFWTSFDAIGGPSSVTETVLPFFNVRTVPGRVREVNVSNTRITL